MKVKLYSLRTAFVAVLALCLSTLAYADTYSLSNTNGGDGYVVGSAPSFQLFGADNDAGSNYTTYTTTVSAPTSLTFDWSYKTLDCCGSEWDPAGYVINGSYTQLSTDGGDYGIYDTSGTTTVSLNSGDTFGWYVYSVDSIGGRGELDVNTPAPAPEPNTLILIGTGALGAAGALKRRLFA